MTGNDYQKLAMRTNDGNSKKRLQRQLDSGISMSISDVLVACLGLSGEVGELTGMVKKFIFHETSLDEIHFQKELGDIMWYIALMCEACGYDMDRIMQMNIKKLKSRYPEGFNVYAANHRHKGDI